MQKKGGAAVLWGVQKIKGRRRMGRACGPGIFVLGRFDPRVLGRVRREYIRGRDIFSFIFHKRFSLFSFFESKRSLLSLVSLHLLRWRSGWRKGIPTRWPASYRGGATASELKLFFFKFFCSILCFLLSRSVFKLRISKKTTYNRRSGN